MLNKMLPLCQVGHSPLSELWTNKSVFVSFQLDKERERLTAMMSHLHMQPGSNCESAPPSKPVKMETVGLS